MSSESRPNGPLTEEGPPAAATALPEPLLVSAQDAARLCGVSPATWARMQAAGRAPGPVRPSPGRVLWRVAELRQWTEAGCPSRREWEALPQAKPAQHNGRR
jgi:predicted DNA-binding transcriptional regulator AlpA